MAVSIKVRLIVLSVLSAGLTAGVGVVSSRGLHESSAAAESLLTTTKAVRAQMEADMMHDALRADVYEALQASTAEEHAEARKNTAEHAEQFRTAVGELAAMADPTVTAALDDVRPALTAYIGAAESACAAAESDPAAARAALPPFLGAFKALETRMEALGDVVEKSGEARAAAAAAARAGAERLVMWTCVAGVLTALLGSGVIAVGVQRSIHAPLARAIDAMNAIAAGDLTRRVGRLGTRELGPVGEATDAMADAMQSLVRELAGAATGVAGAAASIAAASEETSAATAQIADRAASASRAAEESRRVADEGGGAFRAVIEDMAVVNDAVGTGAERVGALGAKGEEIARLVGVIKDVADQTNLLALNAAIEAARAGEHGRGFAVVADEVRKLADRTATVTDEIVGSITAIQAETGAAVKAMTDGRTRVSAGAERAERAGEGLSTIVSGAAQVAEMVGAITASSQEAGSAAGESARVATDLSEKARHLQELFARFKVA